MDVRETDAGMRSFDESIVRAQLLLCRFLRKSLRYVVEEDGC